MPLSESQLEARRAAARLIRSERERLLRIAATQLGGPIPAHEFLASTLGRRLRERDKLHRGESLPSWLERKVEQAAQDWGKQEPARTEEISGKNIAVWNQSLQRCLRELLQVIEPRYREVLGRVDFRAESKILVARELGISRSTMDVLLHRARQAVRRSVEKVCAPSDGV